MERTGPPHGDDPSGQGPPDQGPQSPGGQPSPQSPDGPPGPPPGPQSPGGVHLPPGPQSPEAPQSPSAFPPAPPPGPQSPGGYAGPAPPGGWSQPPAASAVSTAGLASWGSRVGAGIIDGLILLVPVVIIVAVVVGAASGSETAGIVTAIIGFLAYLVVSILYAPLLMARGGAHNGQTLGKQMLGVRVARDTGEPFGFGYALLREFVVKGLLFAGVGQFLLYIPLLVDYLWPLWEDENRALHDLLLSTHVVRA